MIGKTERRANIFRLYGTIKSLLVVKEGRSWNTGEKGGGCSSICHPLHSMTLTYKKSELPYRKKKRKGGRRKPPYFRAGIPENAQQTLDPEG